MRLIADVKFTAYLEINDKEATVLDHLCSYSLAEWFSEHCNKREIPLEQIKAILSNLRCQCAKLIEARKAA